MEKKAIAYLRVTDLTMSSQSELMQKNAIKEFCLKHKIDDVEIYEDHDKMKSAYDRPGFQEMLQAIKQPGDKERIVVISQLDRLSRNMHEVIRFIEDVHDSGIKGVFSADYPDAPLDEYLRPLEIIPNLETMVPRLFMLEPYGEEYSVFVSSGRNLYYVSNEEVSIYLGWNFRADLCELSEDGASIILGDPDKSVIPVSEIWGFAKHVEDIGMFGYTEKDGETVVEAAAADIVKKIFQLEAEGKLK